MATMVAMATFHEKFQMTFPMKVLSHIELCKVGKNDAKFQIHEPFKLES